MNNKPVTIKNILKYKWRTVVVSAIITAFVVFVISLMLPIKYSSSVSLLVIQEQANDKVDAFSATKSAEFLSGIFARVIYTTTFFNAVQEAPFEVRRNFSRDTEEREKQWREFVSVKKVNNTGIIKVTVTGSSRKTAEETAKAIAYTLITHGNEYHGGGERVHIKLIDGPNTPLRPTFPKVFSNTLIGAVCGGVGAVIVLYLMPDYVEFRKRKREEIEENFDENEDEYVNEIGNDEVQGEIVFDGDEREVGEVEHVKSNQDNRFESVVVSENEEEFGQVEDPELEELHRRISKFNK